jgi:hypothetical protein
MSRVEMTAAFYPDKMNVRDFIAEVIEGCEPFISNMEHLKCEDMYAEDWYVLFGAWLEMELPNDNVQIGGCVEIKLPPNVPLFQSWLTRDKYDSIGGDIVNATQERTQQENNQQ